MKKKFIAELSHYKPMSLYHLKCGKFDFPIVTCVTTCPAWKEFFEELPEDKPVKYKITIERVKSTP